MSLVQQVKQILLLYQLENKHQLIQRLKNKHKSIQRLKIMKKRTSTLIDINNNREIFCFRFFKYKLLVRISILSLFEFHILKLATYVWIKTHISIDISHSSSDKTAVKMIGF